MWSYYSTRASSALTTASETRSYSSSYSYTGRTQNDATSSNDSYDWGVTSYSESASSSSEFVGGLMSYTRNTRVGTSSSVYVPFAILSSATGRNSSIVESGLTQVFNFITSSRTTRDNRFFINRSTSIFAEGSSSTNWNSVTQFSRSVFSQFNLTGTSTSSEGLSTTFTFNNTQTSFNSTTTTSTATASLWVTTTSTRVSSYHTFSSADPYTTQKTTTGTATITTYATSSLSVAVFFDLIAEADSNDWAWSVTTSGTDRESNIGASFSAQTFSDQGITSSTSVQYYDVSASGNSSYTYTRPRYSSSSVTSTVSTTTSSAYSLGVASSNTVVPFGSTVSASIGYTTTRTTAFTFSTTTATTSTAFLRSVTFSTDQSSTVSSTFTGGTSIDTKTWTIQTNNAVSRSTGSSGQGASESGATDFGTSSSSSSSAFAIGQTLNSAGLVVAWKQSVSSFGPASMSAREITIGAGFQSPASIGRLQSIGTNLVAGVASSVGSIGLGWPRTDKAPVVTAAADIGLAGSVPITLTNSRTDTRFGGFGWNSTEATTLSASSGVHRITTANSTTSGVTETTWNSTNSTYSLSSGHALVAESVPLVNSRLTTSYSPFVNFPAFPPTSA